MSPPHSTLVHVIADGRTGERVAETLDRLPSR